MKVFLLILAVFMAGCSAVPQLMDPAFVQKLLDSVVPAGFTGDVKIRHKNVYTTVIIQVTGLRRLETGWTWVSFTWEREGRVSDGQITFTPTP